MDIYLLHFPSPPLSLETWADALADAVEEGLTRTVGVSNCDPTQTRRVYKALAARGVPLACNEVGFSLLRRNPEHNGLINVCNELGVTVIAYQPLASGMLSGKYDSEHQPSGIRGLIYGNRYLVQIQPLLGALKRIAKDRGKTVSQVALNWILCKGALPIPGAKNPE